MDEKSVNWNDPEQPPKLIHAGDVYDGEPYIWVGRDRLVFCGGAGGGSETLEEGITIDPEFGTHIQGRMSFSAMPQQISFGGGYYRLNPLHLACIGSSAALNIPWLVWDRPEMLKQEKDFRSLASSFGA